MLVYVFIYVFICMFITGAEIFVVNAIAKFLYL